MFLTRKIKLLPSVEQRKYLIDTFITVNHVCNSISEFAFKNRTFNDFRIHNGVYHQIRKQFGLSSQLTIRAIGKTASTYSDKKKRKTQHHFRWNGALDFDTRLVSIKKNHVSIRLVNSRVKIPFVTELDLSTLKLADQSRLSTKSGKFYLEIMFEVPEQTEIKTNKFLGVDMGIKNLASLSDGQVFSGGQVEQVRRKYCKLKGRLQKRGTKSAKRKLQRISGKEARFKKCTNHIISNQIVSTAQRQHKAIAIEDLAGFKPTVRKEQRDQFGKWAFCQLGSFIEYKSKIAGIPFVKVDPRNTSRTCKHCGYVHKRNRKGEKFKCIRCGYGDHADIQAARVIAIRAAVNRPNVANGLSSGKTERTDNRITTDLKSGKISV